jgi:hypothetical protein
VNLNTIKATATEIDAKRLAAKGAVRAMVHGRPAIVFAEAWDPVTPDPEMAPNIITARAIRTDIQDIEAQGVKEADHETQQLIDRLHWEEWPS